MFFGSIPFPKSRKLLPVTPRCVDATLSPRLESAESAGWLGTRSQSLLPDISPQMPTEIFAG